MQDRISFKYGNFEYDIFNFKNDLTSAPLIKGKFFLSSSTWRSELGQEFYFYDQLQLNCFNWHRSFPNTNIELNFCLGPAYPHHLHKQFPSYLSTFRDILFFSKSSKILDAEKNTTWLHQSKHAAIEGRKEQLMVLSNFYAHYLKKCNFEFTGYILAVPQKPQYSFNSVEIIAQEFSEVLKLPIFKFMKRTSNDLPKYEFISRLSAEFPTDILIIDDILTDGRTMEHISDKFKERGTKKFRGFIWEKPIIPIIGQLVKNQEFLKK